MVKSVNPKESFKECVLDKTINVFYYFTCSFIKIDRESYGFF